MAYTKIYTRIDWKNENESKTTPLGATNLNKMDNAINELDNRAIEIDLVKFDKTEANSLIKDWTIDVKTGLITITKVDGSNMVFDLNVEKIPVNFELTPDGVLKMITDDGQEFTANIAAMIPIITFNESDTIGVTAVDGAQGKEYTFSVKNSSITPDKIVPNYLSDLTVLSNEARQSAQDSQRYSQESKTSSESSEKNASNSEIYKNNAELSAVRAEQLVMQAYDIIKNSGNMNDILEVRNHAIEEFKPQTASVDNIIDIGRVDNGGNILYYAISGNENLYERNGSDWNAITLLDKGLISGMYELKILRESPKGIFILGVSTADADSGRPFIYSNRDGGTECLSYLEPSVGPYSTYNDFIDVEEAYDEIIALSNDGSLFIALGTMAAVSSMTGFRPPDGNSAFNSIAYGKGIYIAVGNGVNDSGIACVITYSGMPNITAEVNVSNSPLVKVVYGDNCFLAFSSDGSVYMSDNGTQWVKVSSLKDFDAQSFLVKDAVYTGKEFVVLTEDLKIFSSEDKGGYWRKVSDANANFKCLYSSGDGNTLIGSVKESIQMIVGTSENLSLTNTVRELYYDNIKNKDKIFFLTSTFPASSSSQTRLFRDARLLKGKYHHSISLTTPLSEDKYRINAIDGLLDLTLLNETTQEITAIIRIELI